MLQDIKNYIEFLHTSGFAVSLSFSDEPLTPFVSSLLAYDFHPHSVCDYLKNNKNTVGRCYANKRALFKIDLKKPFYGCCYAGVEEFVFPVLYREALIARIHVSGYKGNLKRSARFASRIAPLCDEGFFKAYEELSNAAPGLAFVSSFIAPLSHMLCAYYEQLQKAPIALDSNCIIYHKALQIIYESEMPTISCKELSQKLNYAESYLRYVFKKACGMSVQAKINQIRLEKAKRLLSGSRSSVTQIAYALGFCDSNYFSAYFKKQTGISPLAYRKSFK